LPNSGAAFAGFTITKMMAIPSPLGGPTLFFPKAPTAKSGAVHIAVTRTILLPDLWIGRATSRRWWRNIGFSPGSYQRFVSQWR
jgi:hypothetical protein